MTEAHVHHAIDYVEISVNDSEVRAGGPLVILYSGDLENSVEQVTAAGGTILEPIYGFPGGRRFHFADPAGNELAVWSEQA